MDSRDGCQRRAKGIFAISMTWWLWWYIYIYISSFLRGFCFLHKVLLKMNNFFKRSTWPIDGTLTSITTPSNGTEGVLHTSQSSSTEASPSDVMSSVNFMKIHICIQMLGQSYLKVIWKTNSYLWGRSLVSDRRLNTTSDCHSNSYSWFWIQILHSWLVNQSQSSPLF